MRTHVGAKVASATRVHAFDVKMSASSDRKRRCLKHFSAKHRKLREINSWICGNVLMAPPPPPNFPSPHHLSLQRGKRTWNLNIPPVAERDNLTAENTQFNHQSDLANQQIKMYFAICQFSQHLSYNTSAIKALSCQLSFKQAKDNNEEESSALNTGACHQGNCQ